MGALLASELAQEIEGIAHLLLWQPALNGEQHIDQFLRFELAGQMLQGNSGFDRAGLWRELRAGKPLNVAGYRLTPRLALEISHLRLGELQPAAEITWMDIGPKTPKLNPASDRVVERWREQGVSVVLRRVEGEAFWRNIDAQDNPGLVSATVQAMAPT